MTVIFKTILLLALSPFLFDKISCSEVAILSSDALNRAKREIIFRPLFVYKQQQRNRQRLWKIQELFLQQQNSDQQHLQNYEKVVPSVVPVEEDNYKSVLPLRQQPQPTYQQQYEQQYYQQYYDKYFKQFPENSNIL